jgi:hypothetical protein
VLGVEAPEAERPLRSPETEPGLAAATIGLLAAVAIAVSSLILARVKGPPYLDFSALNGWVALFGFAALGALVAVPFTANHLLSARSNEDERWEAAMLVWGAVALAALAIGVLLIAAGGFSPGSSLADAAGLLIVIEAGLVVLCLLGWLLSG